ncbi:MAG: hypothetical protein GXP49_13085 [Deltaproteobacteria bacterium]|nr:hypothetical protein [Deltaproteobacteria bacterium]
MIKIAIRLLIIGVLALLAGSCAVVAQPPKMHVEPAQHQEGRRYDRKGDLCLEPWTVPHRSAVLSGQAVARALTPIYRAIQEAVCGCLQTSAPSAVPEQVKFSITSSPGRGLAVARIVPLKGGGPGKALERSFLECLGTIEARFVPWHLGTCADPKNGDGVLVSSMTVVLWESSR